MRIGIMSAAHLHADAYIHNLRAMRQVVVAGIADDNVARGQQFAAQHDIPYLSSYEALLAQDLDGVLVCSENANHRPLVEMAAQAGVHVLCEKPLATTLADAQVMIDVCKHHNVLLMTAFPMRFSAPLRELKTAVESGSLGRVYAINSTNQGQNPMRHRAWFVDKTLAGGGALMDHIVHLADIFNWLFGRDIVRLYAQSNHILHADAVDVETGGLVMLTYADGLFATIDCSWSKPDNFPTWGGLTLELVSERGLTVVDAFGQNIDVYRQSPAANQWAYWGSDANQAMIEEFVAAIQEQRQPLITGEDGYFALAVTLAAYQAAADNRAVDLSQEA